MFLTVFAFCRTVGAYDTMAYCHVDSNGNLSISSSDPNNAIVQGYFNDSIDTVGWYQLHINSTEGANPENVMRCAGAVEGYLTRRRIFQHFRMINDINNWNMSEGYPEGLNTFLTTNMRYVEESVDAYVESDFWQGIGMIWLQFKGLCEGYNLSNNVDPDEEKVLTPLDLWMMQSEGDLDDLLNIPELVATEINGPTRMMQKVTPGEHCSGLVRLLPDYSDIYFAHDSWSDYRELHGQLKEYRLNIPLFKAHSITMSTRIGKLASYDDFYISDAGLFVLETTINNFNADLYKNVKPQSLMTWIRAVHATWATDNGKDWTETFIRHNSGTYNNEYLVVDSKKFEYGKKPTSDLLWIIEQYPGVHMSKDITDVLVEKGFFPSFNTPWFEELYELAGYPEHVASWGDTGNYWTYNTSARFYIFERDVPRIKTFDDFKAFMRYNNWKRDLYSNGDPGQQIMSRYDQRPKYGNPLLPPRLFGGLDSKCLKVREATWALKFHARASPTNDEENGIPVFEFPDDERYYKGLPKRWDFDWITFESNKEDPCRQAPNKTACLDTPECGWCMFCQKCFPGEKTGPYFDECESGWQVKTVMPKWAIPVIVIVSITVLLFIIAVLVLHVRSRKQTF